MEGSVMSVRWCSRSIPISTSGAGAGELIWKMLSMMLLPCIAKWCSGLMAFKVVEIWVFPRHLSDYCSYYPNFNPLLRPRQIFDCQIFDCQNSAVIIPVSIGFQIKSHFPEVLLILPLIICRRRHYRCRLLIVKECFIRRRKSTSGHLIFTLLFAPCLTHTCLCSPIGWYELIITDAGLDLTGLCSIHILLYSAEFIELTRRALGLRTLLRKTMVIGDLHLSTVCLIASLKFAKSAYLMGNP